MKPGALETLASKINQCKNADCIIFSFELLTNSKGTWETSCPYESLSGKNVFLNSRSSVCKTVFTNASYINVWRKAVRRRCVGLDNVPIIFQSFRNFGDDTFQTVEMLSTVPVSSLSLMFSMNGEGMIQVFQTL